MSAPCSCPTHDRLQALLESTATGDEQAELVGHLDTCECCRHVLDELAAGGSALAQSLRQLGRDQPGKDSAYWSALQRLEQAVGADAATTSPMAPPGPAAETDVSLDFLKPAESPEFIGRLSHFDVVQVVGHGGMGVVLKAFDGCLQRYVALKVLNPQLADNEAARKRFCREARAAASITHEHVVAVHQVEREEGSGLPFLVMQMVSGESLQDYLDRKGPLELKEILRIGAQTASGLAAAHAQGLIHRDIKPANILLENGRVKLTDFGLARAYDDVRLTQTGLVAGTPLYMSPEQARGEELDHRADLFSLGSVLYAMCTGRAPFGGSTPFLVLKGVTEGTPQPIRELNAAIPDWLAEIVNKLLAKHPADRYQSAALVADLLEERLAFVRHSSSLETPALPPAAPATPPVAGRSLLQRFGTFFRAFAGSPAPGQAMATPEPSVPALATFPGNAGPVWSAAFSPDGTLLAMAIDDGTVKLWDANEVRVVATVNAHAAPVWSMAFSPDGRLLATASDDGTVKLWDAERRKELKALKHATSVRAVAFSPDGKRVVTGSRNGTVSIYDVESGQEAITTRGHPGVVMSVAYAPNGGVVVSGSGDKTAKLWDPRTGEERLTLSGHTGGIYGVAVSPDSRLVATGGWDKTVRLWDAGTGNSLAVLSGHEQDIWSVAFSPDGKVLASGSEDRTVKLWDVVAGKEIVTFRGHTASVYCVTFSREGRKVASGGRDGTLKLWAVPATLARGR